MSKNVSTSFNQKNFFDTTFLTAFSSEEKMEMFLRQHPSVWETYSKFPSSLKKELIDFCIGKQGLKITYDPVFRKIFNPTLHPDRLESFLSSILGHAIRIVKIIPREGTQLNEQTSFVIMDVLVQLNDGSFANVEMQNIGYNFPLARADCYASDIIMRQYAQFKMEQRKLFSFKNLHKVYCIILMEQSPQEFHISKNKYIHRRTTSFDTNIYKESSGLHEDIFICLDSFHSNVHNITKDSNKLEAWLTFLSTTDIENISSLVNAFPCFAPIYQEIANFTQNPKELISMLSEALYIMDKNMERIMVTDLQEEVDALKAKYDTTKAERDVIMSELDATETKLQQVLAYARAHGYEE